MAVAVSRAIELGAPSLVAPSAGNAGGALAACGAAGGVPVTVVMPSRRAGREPRRGARRRRARPAPRRADRRVRRRGPADRRRGGRVRPLDDARALPGEGQDDDGPRARRGPGLATARRDRLRRRWRHRHGWSPCRRRAARRSCGRSSAGRPRWSRGRARRRARAAWARHPRWGPAGPRGGAGVRRRRGRGEQLRLGERLLARRAAAGQLRRARTAASAAVRALRERGDLDGGEEVVVFDCGIGQKYPPPAGLAAAERVAG